MHDPSPREPTAGPGTLVGHVDVDAFFAAVEQRDKPSLRGRPVLVGGVGPRGVVATASYEARRYGISSAMPMAEARRRCPGAAVLAGRFGAYRASSEAVMDVARRYAWPLEQVSLDEAYLVLPSTDVAERVASLRADIRAATMLAASVGVGASKLVAKIASDDAKPDGQRLVLDGEQAYLDPLPVRRLPGLGPATQARLARLGVATVAQLRTLGRSELTSLLGEAHGSWLFRLARGVDDRPVTPVHEAKSVSVEETFDTDLTDPVMVERVLTRMAERVARRLAEAGLSGRTVTVKARYPDFATVSRSTTRAGPTDQARVLGQMALSLMDEIDLARGVRLLGVGASGLTWWVQHDLFDTAGTPADAARADAGGAQARRAEPGEGQPDRSARGSAERGPSERGPSERGPSERGPSERGPSERGPSERGPSERGPAAHPPTWLPGQDVVHAEHGRGWVWGSGAGVVTVRFETRDSPAGPVRTFRVDDEGLSPAEPEPLPVTPAAGTSAAVTSAAVAPPLRRAEGPRPPRAG